MSKPRRLERHGDGARPCTRPGRDVNEIHADGLREQRRVDTADEGRAGPLAWRLPRIYAGDVDGRRIEAGDRPHARILGDDRSSREWKGTGVGRPLRRLKGTARWLSYHRGRRPR